MRSDNRLLTLIHYPDEWISNREAWKPVTNRWRRGSEHMRQDLKLVLVFFLFVEVVHTLGYVSGLW